MLMLHRSLAGLGRLAAKEASRNTVTCVLIEDLGKDKSRLTSTDGKRLMRVILEKNPNVSPPKARGFDPSANGSKRALVPAAIFTKVLSEIPVSKELDREFAAVTLEKDQVTCATHSRDDRMKRVTPVEPLSEEAVQFPDVDPVFPKKKPAFRIHMNPTMLGELLLTITSVVGKNRGVTLEFYTKGDSTEIDANGPITVKAKTYKGDVQVEAVIMPLKEAAVL